MESRIYSYACLIIKIIYDISIYLRFFLDLIVELFAKIKFDQKYNILIR